jgi:hypothetical protein
MLRKMTLPMRKAIGGAQLPEDHQEQIDLFCLIGAFTCLKHESQAGCEHRSDMLLPDSHSKRRDQGAIGCKENATTRAGSHTLDNWYAHPTTMLGTCLHCISLELKTMRQVGVVSSSAAVEMLRMQLIFTGVEGRKGALPPSAVLTQLKFKGWDFTQTKTHWGTENKKKKKNDEIR